MRVVRRKDYNPVAIPEPTPPIDVERAEHMWREEGMSCAEIARKLGYHAGSVRNVLRQVIGTNLKRSDAPWLPRLTRARLHYIWRAMHETALRPRCDPNNKDELENIGVCDDWHDFEKFARWANGVGYKPSQRLLLRNVNKSYSPTNCKFGTTAEHRALHLPGSTTPPRALIEAFGESKSVREWSEDRRANVEEATLRLRLQRGWVPEEAIARLSRTQRKSTARRKPLPPRSTLPWPRIRELFQDKGLRPAELGRRFKIDVSTVIGGLKRLGIYKKRTSLRNQNPTYGKLYKVWVSMRERCTMSSHAQWSAVGALGIRYCKEWEEFAAYAKWAHESGYRAGLCLVRRDLKKHYKPSNCLWVTRAEAVKYGHAHRITRKAHWKFEAFGEVKGPLAWSRDPRCNVSLSGLIFRLKKGMSAEEALTTPSQSGDRDPTRKSVLITAFGETKSLEDWGRDFRARVGSGAIGVRLRKGIVPEMAISAHPWKAKLPSNAAR